ncbi:hypothetical protein [Streptomyces sp. NPDC020983]|uniref:hypothetical protein n=1 Tax=Streptomyces sp. NPDC020983 TaxID=3365106 RepID=UPI003799D7F7
MDGLIAIQGGAAGILAAAVMLVLTGRLVPLSVLRDVQHQRDTWQEAHRESEAARAEERAQTRELLEVARVADHVLTSLPRPGEVGHGVAGADADAAR